MSLILLNPQSNQRIPLDRENPLILGRNNVLGCFDKKVSRSHGRITCTDNGKINLVALHTNPCFFMKNGVPPVHQLNKDEEETLTEGDCLGLLPTLFWFQVLSTNNGTVKIEPDETVKSENVREDNADQTGPCRSESTKYSYKIGNPEFEKTKRLPLGMYDTDDIKEPDKSKNTREDEKESKRLNLETDCNAEDKDVKIVTIKEEKSEEGPSTSSVRVDETKEENCKEDKGCSKAESGKPKQRPICKYEQNCFRKNPQHKLEFSHPGDSDYLPYEGRPLCQYGSACYRRSERHKIEFRHLPGWSPTSSLDSSSSRPIVASSPLPAKRRRKKVTRSSDYEDEDDYDLEDPFINDASSDEYIPTDSNSEEDFDDESRETD